MNDIGHERFYQIHTDSPTNVQDTIGHRWEVDVGRRLLRLVVSKVPKISKAVRFGPVAEWDSKTRVECGSSGPMNDCNGTNGYPIISDRMRLLLEEYAPGQAQYLPVVMVHKKNVINTSPYWVLNTLVQVDCLSEERSVYEPGDDPELWDVDGQPVINASLVPVDVALFAVRYWPGFIVVRESLWSTLRRSGLTGIFFAKFPSYAGQKSLHKLVRRFESAPRFDSATVGEPLGTKSVNDARQRHESANAIAARGDISAAVADMKRQKNIKTGRGIAASRVALIERELGVRLPDDYRQFLTDYGWAIFPASQEVVGGPSRGREDVISLTRAFQGVFAPNWPKSMICVSEDGRGGVFCIDTESAANTPSPILYFEHESASEKGGRLIPHFKTVASSLEEWFRYLMAAE